MKNNPDQDVYQRAMSSRVGALQVIVKWPSLRTGSRGSAFVINDNCHLPLALTCDHVVRDEGSQRIGEVRVRMVMPEGVQELKASVLVTDPLHDIALLGIRRLRSYNPQSVSMALAAAVGNIGESVIAVGYCNPLLLFPATSCSRLPALSPGCLREIRQRSQKGGVDSKVIVLDCICTSGMSGSPIVSRNGVSGMCTRISADGTKTFAVSTETIRQVIRGWANSGIMNQGLRGL